MAVDPQLYELLETTATRSVDAVGALREQVEGLNRRIDQVRTDLTEDRRRDDARMERIEQSVDALRHDAANITDHLVALDQACKEINEKAGALVVVHEETDENGEEVRVVEAKGANVGLTPTLKVAVATGCLTPLGLAIINVLGNH